MHNKVCIITGGTSGIGEATAREMAARGYMIYELSRRKQGVGDTIHIPTDVTDEAAVTRAVTCVLEREGHIDVLINNAGFGISGAVEFSALTDAKRQLDVNFFGMVNLCHAVLPAMREAGRGRIVNLSSVAGVISIPFQTFYSVSKAAINAYTKALVNEVKQYGVEVCAIMPGDVCTGFTAAREKNPAGDDVYGGRISRSVSMMERDEKNGMTQQAAGKYIARIATRRHVKPLYAIGAQYKLFCFLEKVLPIRLLSFLVGILYGK